jgi:hypothetical protein
MPSFEAGSFGAETRPLFVITRSNSGKAVAAAATGNGCQAKKKAIVLR